MFEIFWLEKFPMIQISNSEHPRSCQPVLLCGANTMRKNCQVDLEILQKRKFFASWISREKLFEIFRLQNFQIFFNAEPPKRCLPNSSVGRKNNEEKSWVGFQILPKRLLFNYQSETDLPTPIIHHRHDKLVTRLVPRKLQYYGGSTEGKRGHGVRFEIFP